MRENIKDFYGRIIGTRETQTNGNIIARDMHGKILGRYDKAQNVTMDFYGKIISRGDTTSALIWQAYNEYQQQINLTKK